MSHDQQAQRLREIDDLLAECQRHEMTGVRVSYAQLRGLRDAIAAPVPPAANDTIEQATKYAHDIVTWLHRDHYADNTKFEPFDDLLGLLSQIDNMICGWKEPPAAVAVPDALDENEYQDVWNSAFAAGWNDCRKKMLAAAQAQTWTSEQVQAVHEDAGRLLAEFQHKAQAQEEGK